jgi:primosomal protein N' (replication factor Y) (superfamily II helicase)
MSFDQVSEGVYVEVLLPLAIPQSYTYGVPIEFHDQMQMGIRVEVPVRNKLYSGIILSIHRNKPAIKFKNIISVLDKAPIIEPLQITFWSWLAEYYCADLGAVMNVALPNGLKLASETKLLINLDSGWEDLELSDDEYLVSEALSIQNELTIAQIQDILDKKTVYPVIKELLYKGVLVIKEELTQKFKEKSATFIECAPEYIDRPDAALDITTKSDNQSRAVLSYYSLAKKMKRVSQKALCDMAGVDATVIKAIEKKGIFKRYEKIISRIDKDGNDQEYELSPLSPVQSEVYDKVKTAFDDRKVVLLHGVTGSGKTRIFVELINQILDTGGQVLYLLPEIALTSQIVERLRSQIGDKLFVYHSQINDPERVEIWNAAKIRDRLFVGARSSLFLPFYNLKLIIVDEEHDGSFKQENPSPRYQGRDAAVKLATFYSANVILGSATPSLESYLNSAKGKYEYIGMMDRYGDSEMPDIRIINLKEAYKKGLVKEGFSVELLDEIKACLERKEQVLLFQNRRGYAPIISCKFCGWKAECANCDVTLTYHQKFNELKCHYCGYRTKKSDNCPACGNHELELLGSGTEKIEDIIQKLIPTARVERFDYDTTRSKKNQQKILDDFRDGEIDILVGTQMITKGFDFDNISLVGVLNADSLLSYPDFRASERTFQLLMQVGGRAGRRKIRGKVFIQAFMTDHPVLSEVLASDYLRYYNRELAEREKFLYPPFYHMISIWFRNKDLKKAREAAEYFYKELRSKLGSRISKPIDPGVIRVRGQYQQVINVKFEKTSYAVNHGKSLLISAKNALKSHSDYKSVTVTIDVDPG